MAPDETPPDEDVNKTRIENAGKTYTTKNVVTAARLDPHAGRAFGEAWAIPLTQNHRYPCPILDGRR